jgi:hypothetical protein
MRPKYPLFFILSLPQLLNHQKNYTNNPETSTKALKNQINLWKRGKKKRVVRGVGVKYGGEN